MSTLIETVRLRRGALRLIDQTLLPAERRIIMLDTVDGVCDAIRRLAVRGAPALGVAGAYGLLVAIEQRWREGGPYTDVVIDEGGEPDLRIDAFPRDVPADEVRAVVREAAARLRATRPTAVNLGWAIDRMLSVAEGPHDGWAIDRMLSVAEGPHDKARALLGTLLDEARAIHTEDIDMCRRLGAHGAALLGDGDAVITHCNTGGLATGGFGTALGVVFAAVDAGKRIHVYADETRPLLQGARLTAWECREAGVPVTVLVDGAAASLLASGRVACAITGADRIAANGDSANKIGTLSLALAAHRFGVPFYIAAPSSTVDPALAHGGLIPIEERPADEVRALYGRPTAPTGVDVYNPAFDVTPHDLIAGIITERGVHRPPYDFSAE